MKRIVLAAGVVASLGTACGSPQSTVRAEPSRTSPATSPSSGSPTPSPTPTPASAPRFSSTVASIGPETRARMSSSWRQGCPVHIRDLRLLRLSFWGFDRAPHTGELVVHRDVAGDVVEVFRALFDARFPIRRMVLIDVYRGDDARSMAANNTSAFNCRRSAGDPSVWSEHAYGRAIDINPVQNPYVSSTGAVEPQAGASFADRSRDAPGLIRADGVVVRAFRSIGWGWGGDWARSKDYQHFSRSGR